MPHLIPLIIAGLFMAFPATSAPAEEVAVEQRADQAAEGESGQAPRPWLGINVRRLDAELFHRLQLEPPKQDEEGKRDADSINGLLVNNVISDGPADAAGIQLHDVIMDVDGAGFDGSLERFQAILARHEPGDELNLKVLREGRILELPVTCARQGSGQANDWKYPTDRVLGVWQPASDGHWAFHAGPIADPADLAGEGDEERAAEEGRIRTQVVVGPAGVLSHTFTRRSGNERLEVTKAAEGGITVRREQVDEDGRSVRTTSNFDDIKELEAADSEAFAVLTAKRLDVNVSDPEGEDTQAGLKQLAEHLERLRGGQRLDPQLRRLLDRTLEQVEMKRQAEAEGRDIAGILAENERLRRRIEQFARDRDDDEPRYSFEETADGGIRVTVTVGGNTLAPRRYEDEADLEQRAPRAYEEYRRLLEQLK